MTEAGADGRAGLALEIGKAYLRKHGMKTYKGYRVLFTDSGELIHLLRGNISPGRAIRCMVEQDLDGRLHPPRLLSRTEKKALRKLLASGRRGRVKTI